jgi:hypothetical protein
VITVYKVDVPLNAESSVINMPIGAEVLSVGNQREKISLWYKCESTTPSWEPRTFVICGTGKALPARANLTFIGTVLLREGALVIHVFEKKEKVK